ncbi:WD40 repeat domain-containing protein [bacterium]|nr:WD40 repeat domain-containing protein [bacterium]
MVKRLLPLIIICLSVIPLKVFAYPSVVRELSNRSVPPIDLSITSQAVGFDISDDDRYLIIGYSSYIKIMDTASFALASTQPFDYTTDDDLEGTVQGVAYRASDDSIYVSQNDGDLLIFDMDSLASEPVAKNIYPNQDKVLGKIVLNPDDDKLYTINQTDDKIVVYDIGSNDSYEVLLTESGSVDINDMIFVDKTGTTSDEVYVATSNGNVYYMSASGTVAVAILISSGDNLSALASTPTGDYVYVVNSSDTNIYKISTSTHTVSSTIIDVAENSGLTDIIVIDVESPTGTYVYVSGAEGLTVINTANDEIIDLGTTDDSYEPLVTPATPGPLVASSLEDGYLYTSYSDGSIGVISDNPYVGITSLHKTGDTSSATIGTTDTFDITFEADEAGTYTIYAGGDIDKSGGTLLADSNATDSGAVEADTATSLTFSYETNSSVFAEGSNTIFVFVEDADGFIGRDAGTITVDTPPGAITIEGAGFGNGRVYLDFTRLTAEDISYYNIYVSIADDISTRATADAVGTVSQPTSGSTLTAEISGLTNGVTYYLGVEGVDSNDNVGTRSYQDSSGVSVSATPLATGGPAAFSGESGCSLFVVGLPAIALAKEGRSSFVTCHVIFLLVSIFTLVFFRGGYLKIFKISVVFFLILLFSNNAFAREFSPQNWGTEIKVGWWMPSNSTTDQFFGNCCNEMYRLQGGYLYKSMLQAMIGFGFLMENGSAVAVSDGTTSRDKFNFMLIPIETSCAFRADFKENQIVVPYVKVGIDYIFFRENVKGNTTKGVKYGLNAGGGIQFLLEWIDRQASDETEMDSGINDIYLTLEAEYKWVDNFGGSGLDLSGPIYSVGLLFEY